MVSPELQKMKKRSHFFLKYDLFIWLIMKYIATMISIVLSILLFTAVLNILSSNANGSDSVYGLLDVLFLVAGILFGLGMRHWASVSARHVRSKLPVS